MTNYATLLVNILKLIKSLPGRELLLVAASTSTAPSAAPFSLLLSQGYHPLVLQAPGYPPAGGPLPPQEASILLKQGPFTLLLLLPPPPQRPHRVQHQLSGKSSRSSNSRQQSYDLEGQHYQPQASPLDNGRVHSTIPPLQDIFTFGQPLL
jgi:hypothetical protein